MVTMASHERDGECGYDDILEEIIIMSPTESASGCVSSSGSSYFSSPSDFNSPFGSEIGSTETESEEDDFIAELSQLTRWMAEYTFLEDDEDEFPKSSPEAGSNNSQASALSVKLPNSNSNSVYLCKEGFVNTTAEKANSESGIAAPNLSSEICSDKVLTDEQMRPVEVYQLKNQPETKKQGFGHGVKRMKEPQNMQNNKGGKSWRKRMLNPPHHHPHPHPPAAAGVSPQNGSGMRAVFLGGSSTRNGSSGTGVFLPTGAYRTAEPKRKPGGCSTVLIPARVLQTLQQHFNNVGAVSQSKGGDASTNSPWQNDVLARINELLSQQKERAEFQPRPGLARVNDDREEVKLPQEWTY